MSQRKIYLKIRKAERQPLDSFVWENLPNFSSVVYPDKTAVFTAIAKMELILTSYSDPYIYPYGDQSKKRLLTNAEFRNIESNLYALNLYKDNGNLPYIDLLFALFKAGNRDIEGALTDFQALEKAYPTCWRSYYFHAYYLCAITNESKSPEQRELLMRAASQVASAVIATDERTFMSWYPNDARIYYSMVYLKSSIEAALPLHPVPTSTPAVELVAPKENPVRLKAVGQKEPKHFDSERYDVLFGRRSFCVAEDVLADVMQIPLVRSS